MLSGFVLAVPVVLGKDSSAGDLGGATAAFEEEKRLEGSWCALHRQGTLALFGIAHLKRFVAPSIGVVCHLGCKQFYARARVERHFLLVC